MCADRAWQDAFGGRCFAGCVGVERTLPGCPVPFTCFEHKTALALGRSRCERRKKNVAFGLSLGL